VLTRLRHCLDELETVGERKTDWKTVAVEEPPPMNRADKFRRNADDCREQAERCHNPLDKERWLKIAENWLKMALEAEADPRSSR
jgi:hypothetical protein